MFNVTTIGGGAGYTPSRLLAWGLGYKWGDVQVAIGAHFVHSPTTPSILSPAINDFRIVLKAGVHQIISGTRHQQIIPRVFIHLISDYKPIPQIYSRPKFSLFAPQNMIGQAIKENRMNRAVIPSTVPRLIVENNAAIIVK